MARVGLCCTFLEAPIKFRTTTARYVTTLAPKLRPGFLNELAVHNARALDDAIAWCAAHGIGAFRVNSGVLPLYTHPERGWLLAGAAGRGVSELLRAAGSRARAADVRLSFHPDQFVVPGSLRADVVESSLRELEYMGEVAELIGAEQITIHGGGAQGGKAASLARLGDGLKRLSRTARSRLVLENDDRIYTVEDLLPLCEQLDLPLIYDVHHHRCNPDRLSVDEATELAGATWHGREPWVHLSSPALGWKGSDPRPHADYIDPKDVPRSWLDRDVTIDVEAKAKELAVLRLMRWIKTTRSGEGYGRGRSRPRPARSPLRSGTARARRRRPSHRG